MGGRTASWCLCHQSPGAISAQTKHSTGKSLLTGAGKWVRDQLPQSSKELHISSALVSHHPGTSRADNRDDKDHGTYRFCHRRNHVRIVMEDPLQMSLILVPQVCAFADTWVPPYPLPILPCLSLGSAPAAGPGLCAAWVPDTSLDPLAGPHHSVYP